MSDILEAKKKEAFDAGIQARKTNKMNICPDKFAGYEKDFSSGYESEYAKELNTGEDLSFIEEANPNIE